MMYYESLNQDKKNIDDNVKKRVHTIKGLEPWRFYRIRVACESSGGLGRYSDWVEQRTLPGGEFYYSCYNFQLADHTTVARNPVLIW